MIRVFTNKSWSNHFPHYTFAKVESSLSSSFLLNLYPSIRLVVFWLIPDSEDSPSMLIFILYHYALSTISRLDLDSFSYQCDQQIKKQMKIKGKCELEQLLFITIVWITMHLSYEFLFSQVSQDCSLSFLVFRYCDEHIFHDFLYHSRHELRNRFNLSKYPSPHFPK